MSDIAHGESGHEFGRVGNGFIDAWGVRRFFISDGTRVYHFTFSDMMGPHFENVKGREQPYPPESAKIWRPFHLWLEQGKRYDKREIRGSFPCVWDEPTPTILRHNGGRNYSVVSQGSSQWSATMVEGSKRHKEYLARTKKLEATP
jgi:hypothetical protein